MNESQKKLEQQEGTETVLLQIKVPYLLREELRVKAKQERRSLSAQAAIFLEEGLTNPKFLNDITTRATFISSQV